MGLQEQFHQQGLQGLGVMVVEVFVAQGDEGAQAVLDPIGVAVIGEAVRHLVKKRQTLLDPAQQQGAGIGSDGTAVKISHHTAASEAFKLQWFGGTLCRHRFSFKNLVNSLHKSILPDSENRCDLPVVRNAG